MRKIILLLSALSLVGTALAEGMKGQMTVAFGWVKQSDGTQRDITGVKIDYTAHPVVAGLIGRDGKVRPDNRHINPYLAGLNQTRTTSRLDSVLTPGLTSGGGDDLLNIQAENLIYNAGVTGTTGFAILNPAEFMDPSSLDDINITVPGSGKVWSKMRFGLHVEASSTHQILFRIRVFNTQVSSPPGQMDFSGEVADFGAYMTPIDPNTSATNIYEMSGAGMSQAGVVIPDTDCFVAMQFREKQFPVEHGEGSFSPFMYNVYEAQDPPSVGSSLDSWIYDNDPLDGIYEDTEIDAFEAPNHGNLALGMWANSDSQSATGLPTAVTTVTGTNTTGNFVSLWFTDTNTYDVVESFAIPRNAPGVDTRIDGVIPTQAPLSIRLQVTTKIDVQPSTQKVEMWRFGGTPGWVLMDTRQTVPGGVNTIDVLYGGSIPLSQFVGSNGTVRARITTYRGVTFSAAPIIARMNKVNWLINY